MDKNFNIIITAEYACITTPYNADYVRKIKKLGGIWNPNQYWVIDKRDVEAARAIMRSIYGRDDTPADLLDLRIRAKSDYVVKGLSIILFARTIARGNDSNNAVEMGTGQVLICV